MKMNTLVTSTTIEPAATEGRECGPEGSQDVAQPSSNGSRLRHSRPTTPGDNGVSTDETACAITDECTYETDEIDEPEEPEEKEEAEEMQELEEIQELEERQELDRLDPKHWTRIDEALSECRVYRDRDVNRPLFMLAHEVSSIEEELNARLSMDVIADVVRRWKALNHDHLEDDHDYLTEFFDKLSLVRFPKGRALARAVEIARNVVPPKQTARLSSGVQLLASLCNVLQRQAGKKLFFLDGRSAAKAISEPHRTVASWLRALCRLGVIKRLSKGGPGMASRYVYLAKRAKR
jgi:hypothetical protein